jgi:hypothetical protein
MLEFETDDLAAICVHNNNGRQLVLELIFRLRPTLNDLLKRIKETELWNI